MSKLSVIILSYAIDDEVYRMKLSVAWSMKSVMCINGISLPRNNSSKFVPPKPTALVNYCSSPIGG